LGLVKTELKAYRNGNSSIPQDAFVVRLDGIVNLSQDITLKGGQGSIVGKRFKL
jgi:hypothetical protein